MLTPATAQRPALRFVNASDKLHAPLPYYQHGIPAGFPSPAADYTQKNLDIHDHLVKNPAATYFAHVEGSSMIDANLNDGDLIVIDRSVTPKHNSIVVAILNQEYLVKRLYKRNGQIKLVPENKAYPTIEIQEGMDFEVWGVVTHIIHKAQ